MLRQQHQFFVALFALTDAVVVAGACVVAWMAGQSLVGRPILPDEGWLAGMRGSGMVFALPVVLGTLWAFGLYRPRRDQSLGSEQAALIRASAAAVAAVVVMLWATRPEGPSGGSVAVFGRLVDVGRVQIAVFAAVLPALLCLHRASLRLVLRQLRKRGRNLRHVAVVGVGRLGQIVTRTLSRNSWTGIHVAYFVSHHPQTNRAECLGRPVLGGLDQLAEIIAAHRVDAVYLALPNAQAAAMPQVLQTLDKFAVDVRIIPDVLPRFVAQGMIVNELDGMPVLSYRECPSSGLGGLTKRILDLVGALAATVLFSPILILVATVVKLTTPGPMIFRQKRVSLGGKVFEIYKFRTMQHVEDEQNGALHAHLKDGWTLRDDPRVTPIGKWLRRTSLDELPQLLNVLKGEMSLVGPRPERPELIERFREDWRGYMLRQHVKAGMTGWAQVNGLRGQSSLRKRLRYDRYYVRHWSLWFDLRILWLTVFRGFVHRNAH